MAKTQFTALMLERKINLEDIQDHKVVSVMSHKFNLLLLSSGAWCPSFINYVFLGYKNLLRSVEYAGKSMVHGMAYISTGISTQNKFQGFLEYDMLRGKQVKNYSMCWKK